MGVGQVDRNASPTLTANVNDATSSGVDGRAAIATADAYVGLGPDKSPETRDGSGGPEANLLAEHPLVGPYASAALAAGRSCQAAGHQLLECASGLDSSGHPLAQQLSEDGNALLSTGKQLAADPVKGAESVASDQIPRLASTGLAKVQAAEANSEEDEGLLDAARTTYLSVKSSWNGFVENVRTASADIPTNVQALGVGDSYVFDARADLMVKTKKGGGDATPQGPVTGSAALDVYGRLGLQVKRDEQGYVVSGLGNAGAGKLLTATASGKRVSASADLQLTGSVGGRWEMRFATAEEAARAVELLPQALTSDAAFEELRSHTSALEVNADVAGSFFGSVPDLRMALKKTLGVNAAVLASAKVSGQGRVEWNAAGKPELVLQVTASADGAIAAMTTATAAVGGGKAALGTKGADAQQGRTATLEARMELPPGTDVSAVMIDAATFLPLAAQTLDTGARKLTLGSDEFGHTLAGGTQGVSKKLVIQGAFDLSELVTDPAALESFAAGNPKELVGKLPDGAQLKYTEEPYAKYGLKLVPGGGAGRVAVMFLLESQRTDVDEAKKLSATGTPAEVSTQLESREKEALALKQVRLNAVAM